MGQEFRLLIELMVCFLFETTKVIDLGKIFTLSAFRVIHVNGGWGGTAEMRNGLGELVGVQAIYSKVTVIGVYARAQ